ncbi:tRNA pseudouridine38-40 synthase [Rhodobacteraceae bacterium MBR-64]|jgi:tRNA pseudouridine38-40 synthase
MPRYAFKLEYDGGPFCGWQRQAAQPSVQETLERALARIDPAAPIAYAAGRTDTGVHAAGQVAHADLSRVWEAQRLRAAINHHLRPHPVAVVAVAPVDEDFHARFSAVGRSYLFRVVTRQAPLTHDRGQVWHLRHALAIEPMQQGARHLIGHHDFTTFRASQCQALSPVKTLDEVVITTHPYPHGQEFRFFLRSRSFLHNQVRSIVGTLERVGAGAWAPEDVGRALAMRDRAACGPVAPPQGLSLVAVRYPSDPFAGAGAAP